MASKIKWSPQQEEALTKAEEWIRNPDGQQVFYLAGYAGTGKSTLARHLAKSVKGNVIYGAYTGKAALVMRKMGCSEATTIHRMIYTPKEKSTRRLTALKRELIGLENKWKDLPIGDGPTGKKANIGHEIEDISKQIKYEQRELKKPSFNKKEAVDVRRASLIVIDECSMVGSKMGEDLLSFDVPVLVLGDPAQLPPIKSGGYFTNRKPDIMLTEIHRQAENSPVIELATMIRQGDRPQLGDYGSSRVVPKGELSLTDLLGYDQIIVGRNKTRKDLNTQIREALGIEDPLPVPGDKVICLRNDHDLGLLNGSLWTVVYQSIIDEDTMMMTIKDENQELPVIAHRHYIENREDELLHWAVRDAQCFTYGYCITAHKSQGSSWPNVLIIDESRDFGKDEFKHLYTSVTRASESVTIVDKCGYCRPKTEEVSTPW